MANNQQADNQTFSCSVCLEEHPVTEKVFCGFDGSGVERHSFCHNCIVGLATASTEDTPLADGQLQCMERGCKNPIPYTVELQKLLPKNVKERLDERMMEENLAKSGIKLERCRDCNFAVEMEQTNKKTLIFPCLKCSKKWCRNCGREWNDEHKRMGCYQVDAKYNIDGKAREVERQLDDAVIRTCQCGLQFTKGDGCNKMTCRCGITQCYICRKKRVTYDHFCRHIRDPNCKCANKCLLWGDTNKMDQIALDRIYAQAAKEGIDLKHNENSKNREDCRSKLSRENEKVQDEQENREIATEILAREAQRKREAAKLPSFVEPEQQIAQSRRQIEYEIRRAAQQLQQRLPPGAQTQEAFLQRQEAIRKIVKQEQEKLQVQEDDRRRQVEAQRRGQEAERRRQKVARQRQEEAEHQRQEFARQAQEFARQRQEEARQRQEEAEREGQE